MTDGDPLAEARDLIERLLEDRMTPAEAERFERLARDRKDVRRLYLRYMYLVSNLPHHVAPHEWILGEDPDADGPAMRPLDETAIYPAVREADLTDHTPPSVPLVATAWVPPGQPARWTRRRLTAATAAVVSLGVGTWVGLKARPAVPVAQSAPSPSVPQAPPVAVAPTVPARLVATAAVVWKGGDAIRPGTDFWTGRMVRLASGAVEVQLGTGVRLIVEGPAAFRSTDMNQVDLDYGKLVARVPPQARGFGVTFGGQRVTDLGTEFGLAAPAGGRDRATVAVFDGRVVLGRADDSAAAATPATRPAPTYLTQGNAASADAGGGWTPVAPSTVRFARSLGDVRVALPIVSTGVGLTVGQTDPHWLVFAMADGQASARPAFVVPSVGWADNAPDRSQWLTTTANAAELPAGLYVFRTTVDLTGLDPATAVVRADVWADDAVDDVRVNGASRHLSVPVSTRRLNWRQPHPLNLRGGFAPGRNTVEFVVYNSSTPPVHRTSKMGFRADLHGEAMPLAVR